MNRLGLLAVVAMGLAYATGAFAGWPEVGENDFRITFEGGTGQAPPNARTAATAFNPLLQEYLVFWVASEFENDLKGRRFSTEGSPVGDEFFVAEASDILHVDVAYDSTRDRYLLIWWQDVVQQIRGRLVSPTGTLLSSTVPLVSACSAPASCVPSVVYNTAADEYLVVWEWDETNMSRRIMAQRIEGATGAQLFAPFAISDGIGEEHDPVVAYHPAAGEYLVVWTAIRPGDIELRAQRLDGVAAGQVGANDFPISDMSGPLPEENYGAFFPDIVYNSLDLEYLVVWLGRDGTGPLADEELELYGQRLLADGTEVGTNDFRLSDVGGIGEVTYFPLSPRVSFLEAAGLYLVVWDGTDDVDGLHLQEREIFGQLLDREGGEIGPNDVRLSDAGGLGSSRYAATNPRVAAGESSEEFLVIWTADEDLPGMAEDELEVYGQRIDTQLDIFADGFESGDVSAWSVSVP